MLSEALTSMDSFIFDDDYEEVGGEVEAFCPKCKADTTHTVMTRFEDEIRRVQCGVCGDVHSYRKPRGEPEDEAPEPISAKKRALAKKLTYEEFFKKHDSRKAREYSPRETYDDNAMISHPKFGVGFVSEVILETPNVPGKIEVTFHDERRLLVHGWKAGPLTLPQGPTSGKGKGKRWETPPPPPPPPSKSKKAAAPAAPSSPEAASKAAPAKAKGAADPAAPAGKAAVGKVPAGKAAAGKAPAGKAPAGKAAAPAAKAAAAKAKSSKAGKPEKKVGKAAKKVAPTKAKAGKKAKADGKKKSAVKKKAEKKAAKKDKKKK